MDPQNLKCKATFRYGSKVDIRGNANIVLMLYQSIVVYKSCLLCVGGGGISCMWNQKKNKE